MSSDSCTEDRLNWNTSLPCKTPGEFGKKLEEEKNMFFKLKNV